MSVLSNEEDDVFQALLRHPDDDVLMNQLISRVQLVLMLGLVFRP